MGSCSPDEVEKIAPCPMQVVAPVRGDLERLICEEARKAIDNDAERELSTLPVQVKQSSTFPSFFCSSF